MILYFWPPLHPLSKLPAIQDHAQNLEEQLWMGGRREVSILSHRPVTSSDLKQERLCFSESVSLVVTRPATTTTTETRDIFFRDYFRRFFAYNVQHTFWKICLPPSHDQHCQPWSEWQCVCRFNLQDSVRLSSHEQRSLRLRSPRKYP